MYSTYTHIFVMLHVLKMFVKFVYFHSGIEFEY